MMRTMNRNLILSAAFVLALFSACSSGDANKAAATTADSLQAALIFTDSALAKIDVEMAEHMAEEIKNNAQFIQRAINKAGDTLDFKTGLLLSNYRALYEDCEVVVKNHKLLGAAIDSSSVNLENLIHDLRNNNMNTGLTPDSAIAHERRQVSQLNIFVKEMQSKLTTARSSYDTLAPKVELFLLDVSQRSGLQPMALPTEKEKERR